MAEDGTKPGKADSAQDAGDTDGDGRVERPDPVSAAFTARASGEPVEDLSRRTETSRTFVNPDGTATDEISAGPQRVQDEDGAWRDVDLDLDEQPDGTFAPRVAPSDVIVGGGGTTLAAQIGLGDEESLKVMWPEVLPEPTIDGGVATFKLSDASDLIVITTKTGVAVRIRLNEQPAPEDPALKLHLRTEGLDVDTTNAGGLMIADDAGKTIAMTAPMTAWDSRVDESGDPTNVVPVEPMLEETVAKGDGVKTDLTLSADEGFLDDPQTQYPVIVDPDIAAVTKWRDTMVRSGITDPKGTDPRLWLGRLAESTSTEAWQSYFQWKTEALTGKTIISATAKFFQYSAGGCGKSFGVFPLSEGFSEGSTVYTNRPSYSTTNSTSSTAGPCNATDGWVQVNVKNMVQAWATTPSSNYGLRLSIASANYSDATYSRRFCSLNENSANAPCDVASHNPILSVTYNTAPTLSSLSVAPWQRGDGTTYVNSATPNLYVTPYDQESAVDLTFQIHNSTAGTAASLKSSCTKTAAASGVDAYCKPTTTLPDGSYYARVRATDPQGSSSAWSSWLPFVIDTSVPTFNSITCTNGISMDQWYDVRPATTTNCQYAVSNAKEVWFAVGNSTTGATDFNIVQVAGGVASTGSIPVPESGAVTIRAIAWSRAGAMTEQATSFGVGSGNIDLPLEGDRSTSTFPIQATGPATAVKAKLQWRRAPETPSPTFGWHDATELSTGSTGWTGNVVDAGGAGKRTPDGLVWNPTVETDPDLAEAIGDRALIQTRVVFTNNLLTNYASQLRTVAVVPHAFGGSFPTTDLGPGEVSLFTGEFQYSASDVAVAGMSVGRSHLSQAGSDTDGVFGPGWDSDIGGELGTAGFSVVDRSGLDGSITLVDADGASHVYANASGTRGALATGIYSPVGETVSDGDRLEMSGGSGDITRRLTLIQQDGTKTRWATKTDPASWPDSGAAFWVEQVTGPGDDSKTTFAADASGRTTWIISPAPAGKTCTAATLAAAQAPNATTEEKGTVRGCRALELAYASVGAETRVDTVWAHLWDPAASAMSRTAVAKYSYNSSGLLNEAWDPRISPALKTTYTYSGSATRPRLATITEPGLKPWQVSYDSEGRVDQISRERPSGSTATWSIDYSTGLSTSGDGFPDMSPTVTAGWGQTSLSNRPADGAAVYGPGIPDGLSTADRNEYATLLYFTKNGRTTNSAQYGAGRWQIGTTGYDAQGNVTSELSPAGRLKVLAEGAASASKYSTLTVYNQAKEATSTEAGLDAGVRVEQVYSPMSEVRTGAGETITARRLVETDYDDEVDASLRPGRPAVPEGGFNLPVRERTSATTESVPSDSPARIDTQSTRYEYQPAVTGDGDGWTLRTPVTTISGVGTSAESTTVTRYDTEGNGIQTRTPQGVAETDHARWTNTVRYTADSSSGRAECRNRPEWEGLTCWAGPDIQPTGINPIPETSISSYAISLEPTRVAETVGGADRKVTTTSYDSAGRDSTESIATPGVTDTDVPTTSTSYDASTGLPVTVAAGSVTMATGYDSWGRITSTTDGYGNTAATTFDAAGRVSTVNDGKGTSTYHYDGTDANGLKERRGLATGLDIGVGTFEVNGAYDANANLIRQDLDSVTATWQYDLEGNARAKSTSLGSVGALTYSQAANAQGQILAETQHVSSQAYTYDGRGRLSKVKEQRQDPGGVSSCYTRVYGLTLDSNRTSLTTYGPNGSSGCQESTAASTVTRTYNAADRATEAGYDTLGRTTAVPAADLGAGSTAVTVGYHGNDMVRTLAAGAQSQTYDLDAGSRVHQITTATSGTDLSQTINHYAGTSDSPTWSTFKTRDSGTDPWTETWTRYIPDLAGGLGVTTDSDGLTQVQIGNAAGDIVATWDLTGASAGTMTTFSETSEFGQQNSEAGPGRYGWLGTNQRDAGTALAGLTLMGVRLYNPTAGRFLTRDPIPGGNDNAYIYPADPINLTDLTGLYAEFYGPWRNSSLKREYHYSGWYLVWSGCICHHAMRKDKDVVYTYIRDVFRMVRGQQKLIGFQYGKRTLLFHKYRYFYGFFTRTTYWIYDGMGPIITARPTYYRPDRT